MMLLRHEEGDAAMRYEIMELDSEIEIHIQQPGEHTSQVHASMQDCEQAAANAQLTSTTGCRT